MSHERVLNETALLIPQHLILDLALDGEETHAGAVVGQGVLDTVTSPFHAVSHFGLSQKLNHWIGISPCRSICGSQ